MGWWCLLIHGGYGRAIMIDHGHGISTRYGHLANFAGTAGQHVHRGDTIGYVGSKRPSTGPNLHYESSRINELQSILISILRAHLRMLVDSQPAAREQSFCFWCPVSRNENWKLFTVLSPSSALKPPSNFRDFVGRIAPKFLRRPRRQE